MRKFILITAMVLASATAQAGERSLSVSGSDNSVSPAPAGSASAQMVETPKVSETAAPITSDAPAASETPKYVERPALVEPKGEPSNAQPSKPVAEKTALAPKPRRTAHKGYWTEGRIIGELHRHGIYW